MRRIKLDCQVQRGCHYCVDMIPGQKVKRYYKPKRCPYEECPYHQLDGFKTYTEYLKSVGGDTITNVLKTAGLKRLG